MIPIGIKNLTANTLYIKELQVEVSGNQTFFLGTYDFFDLAAAQSLKDFINAGSAVIIRDGVQLSQADSLAYVTTPSSGGGGSGEANTASNVGTGAGVFKQKTGVDLEFKSISSADFNVSGGTNEIEIQAGPSIITNQASVTPASGMEVLLNDSGSLKKADVSTFLGGGGGKSEFPQITKARIHQFNRYSTHSNFDGRIFNGICREVPISFTGDVVLTKVECRQTNSSSGASANGGRLGIYKLHSIVASGAQAGNFRFDKVYQESQTFDFSSALAGTDQEITLTTPQTLQAGELYIIAIVDDYATNDATSPTLFGRRGISPARPFSSAINNQRANNASHFFTQPNLAQVTPLTITGGVMVNSCVFKTDGYNLGESASKCLLTIQNA